MIKYGDLNENSKSDDDPSKKAAFVETDGFKVLSKEAAAKEKSNLIEIKAIPAEGYTGVNRGKDFFPGHRE